MIAIRCAIRPPLRRYAFCLVPLGAGDVLRQVGWTLATASGTQEERVREESR